MLKRKSKAIDKNNNEKPPRDIGLKLIKTQTYYHLLKLMLCILNLRDPFFSPFLYRVPRPLNFYVIQI